MLKEVNIDNSNKILSLTKCGDLFTNNKDIAKKEYRELCWTWFPDNLSNDKKSLGEEVSKKINQLYEEAKKCFATNKWEISNVLFFNDIDNKKYSITYLKDISNEMGITYIGETSLTYVIEKSKEKYYNAYIENINNLKFADDNMKIEFQRLLPKIYKNTKDDRGNYCIVLQKTSDVFCLRDILNYYNNKIPHNHVAWIISRLMNLLCFLEFNHLSHNGITIDNCYISPKYHTIMIYGGWWYAKEIGTKMLGTTKEIYDVMPLLNKNTKISNISTDIESVKLIGRILLGNKSVVSLDNEIPKAFRDWLSNGSKKSAFIEFDMWTKALFNSYGKRSFKEMEINKTNIYN